jgi:hypothetical protein
VAKDGSSTWFYLGLIQLFLGMNVEAALLQWVFGSSGTGFLILAGYFMLTKNRANKNDAEGDYNKEERSAITRNSDGSLMEVPLKSDQTGFNRIMTMVWFSLMFIGLIWKMNGS